MDFWSGNYAIIGKRFKMLLVLSLAWQIITISATLAADIRPLLYQQRITNSHLGKRVNNNGVHKSLNTMRRDVSDGDNIEWLDGGRTKYQTNTSPLEGRMNHDRMISERGDNSNNNPTSRPGMDQKRLWKNAGDQPKGAVAPPQRNNSDSQSANSAISV